MKSIISVLVLLVAFGCVISAVFLSMAVNRSADVVAVSVAEAMTERDPMDELMALRQADSDAHRSRAGWWFAGLVLVVIMALGGTIQFMNAGTPFFRQLKQLRRASSSRPALHRPAIQWADMPTVGRVPSVPQLTDGEEDGEWVE